MKAYYALTLIEITSSYKFGALNKKGECALVNHSKDKCHFVKKHCKDQQEGFINYLELHYCYFNSTIYGIIIISLSLVLAFIFIGNVASDFFCPNLGTISTTLQLSESVAGVTLLAFGNGSNDLFSTFSAFQSNSGGMAIGELVGAAWFITSVVVGSMAIIQPFEVDRKLFLRDLWFFIGAVMILIIIIWDGTISFPEGGLLCVYYTVYVLVVVFFDNEEPLKVDNEETALVGRTQTATNFISPNPRLLPVTPMTYYKRMSFWTAEDIEGALKSINGVNSNNSTLDNSNLRYGLNNSHFHHIPMTPGIKTGNRFVRHKFRPRRVSKDFRSTSSKVKSLSRAQSVSPSAEFSELEMPFKRINSVDSPMGSYIKEAENYLKKASMANDEIDGNCMSVASPKEIPSPAININNSFTKDVVSNFKNKNTPSSIKSDTGSLKRENAPRFISIPDSTSEINDLMNTIESTGTYNSESNVQNTSNNRKHRPSLSINSSVANQSSTLSIPNNNESKVRFSNDDTQCEINMPKYLEPESCVTQESWDDDQSVYYELNSIIYLFFPGLKYWDEQNIYEKFTNIISLPFIFILSITVPVVVSPVNSDNPLENLAPYNHQEYEHGSHNNTTSAIDITMTSATPLESRAESIKSVNSSKSDASVLEEHYILILNRILTITIPLFLYFTIFIPNGIFSFTLIGLAKVVVWSMLNLCVFELLRHYDHLPKSLFYPSFFGFVLSLNWISLIATEVVDILKSLGLILNINEEIIGLTVFAMGNSLGDLVANLSVARMGFPMMAVSACFAGPMLNTMLGVGISGVSIGLFKDKPVHLDISLAIYCSSLLLLGTLVLYHVVLRRTRFLVDKRIGVTVIVVYAVGMVFNIALDYGF